MERVFREQGCEPARGFAAIRRECGTRFMDPAFGLLGAEEVTSLDASAYERADLIHDANRPVPEDWHERYDVVLDAGSLEHVFDFPTAIRSCMQMVRVGGHFIGNTPTDNWSGHGFYQFSAELFFRLLAPENGFRVRRMLLYEHFDHGAFYEVADPAVVGSRVQLVSGQRLSLHVLARKEAPLADRLGRVPQQTEWVDRWDRSTSSGRIEPEKPARRRRRKALRGGLLRGAARFSERLAGCLARADARRRNRRYSVARAGGSLRRTKP
jgi:hypothetical protein